MEVEKVRSSFGSYASSWVTSDSWIPAIPCISINASQLTLLSENTPKWWSLSSLNRASGIVDELPELSVLSGSLSSLRIPICWRNSWRSIWGFSWRSPRTSSDNIWSSFGGFSPSFLLPTVWVSSFGSLDELGGDWLTTEFLLSSCSLWWIKWTLGWAFTLSNPQEGNIEMKFLEGNHLNFPDDVIVVEVDLGWRWGRLRYASGP